MMTQTTIRLFIAAFVAVAFFGCGSGSGSSSHTAAVVQVHDGDDGKAITLAVGDTLAVALASNPTTGYSWEEVSILDNILEKSGDPFFTEAEDCNGRVGCDGTTAFRYQAVHSGRMDLNLQYQRPWESLPPLKTFKLTVTVRP